MVCSRLRSLPYRYMCRIKAQMVLNVVAEKWLKQYYIMSIKRGKERRECEGESEIERRRVVRGGVC